MRSSGRKVGEMSDVKAISDYLQSRLHDEQVHEVAAVPAATRSVHRRLLLYGPVTASV